MEKIIEVENLEEWTTNRSGVYLSTPTLPDFYVVVNKNGKILDKGGLTLCFFTKKIINEIDLVINRKIILNEI